MSGTSMQCTIVSASAASIPAVKPSMMPTSVWPAARWRAGVKNISVAQPVGRRVDE